MGKKRVVITGMGAITPIGNNLIEYTSALKNGLSGCEEIKSFDTTKFKTKFACEVKSYDPLDYFDKKVEVVKMHDAPEVVGDFDMILENAQGKKKRIYFDNPEVPEVNAILMELECFADAIVNDTPIIVPLTQGKDALDVALQITALVEKSSV